MAACEVQINAPDGLSFDLKELSVERSCGTVKLTFTHTGKLAKNIMGHNWVLSKAADLTGIATDGQKAGLDMTTSSLAIRGCSRSQRSLVEASQRQSISLSRG